MSSEVKILLQELKNDGTKKAWKWEKHVSCHVKYHINESIIEYGHQRKGSGMKVWIRCDRISSVVASYRSHTDKYEKNCDSVVVYLLQCVGKQGQTISVKVSSTAEERSAKKQSPAEPTVPSN